MDQAGDAHGREHACRPPRGGRVGVFSNVTLDGLYADLLAQGRRSEEGPLEGSCGKLNI